MIKIVAYSQILIFNKNFIHIFHNVEKTLVLQRNFKNIKILQYDLNNKELLTFIT